MAPLLGKLRCCNAVGIACCRGCALSCSDMLRCTAALPHYLAHAEFDKPSMAMGSCQHEGRVALLIPYSVDGHAWRLCSHCNNNGVGCNIVVSAPHAARFEQHHSRLLGMPAAVDATLQLDGCQPGGAQSPCAAVRKAVALTRMIVALGNGVLHPTAAVLSPVACCCCVAVVRTHTVLARAAQAHPARLRPCGVSAERKKS